MPGPDLYSESPSHRNLGQLILSVVLLLSQPRHKRPGTDFYHARNIWIRV